MADGRGDGGEFAGAGGDALLLRYERIALEEAQRRKLFGAALGAALAIHAVALVVHWPVSESEPVLSPPRVVATLYPTPALQQKPVAPPAPKKKVKRQPVPDATPAEPEPLRAAEPAEAQPQPYALVAGDVVPPRKLFAPQPPYPDVARRIRREGVVILELLVERDGTISSIRSTTELGFGLEESALSTVRSWRLEPALLHGKPIAVLYRLHVRFELDWHEQGYTTARTRSRRDG